MINRVIAVFMLCLASVYANPFSDYREIAEKSYLYRMQVNESYVYLKKVMSKGYLLTARDVLLISEEGKKRIDLGRDASQFMSKNLKSVWRFNNTKEDFLRVSMYLGVFTSVADAYFYSYDQFSRNYKIRRILEEENISIGQSRGAFSSSIKDLFSFKVRKDVIKALSIFNKYKSRHSNNKIISKTVKHIEDSYTYKSRVGLGYAYGLVGYGNFIKRRFVAFKSNNLLKLRQATLKVLYTGSKLFGNTAGKFQSRRGKLYHDEVFIKTAMDSLSPLDTILEKTPFRLTDKFIPGYWGHAAIYIGNEEQLRELGLWDHPKIRKYQDRIRSGATIVEALRSGVEINSVRHFSDIDDFTILRPGQDFSDAEKRDYILRVISHIGKEYDFAFNVETPSKIVCSELHYLTYLDVKFDIEYILGQPTISVDSVAAQGMYQRYFAPISLYIDGKRMVDKVQFRFDRLLSTLETAFMSTEDKYKHYLD